MPSSSEPDARAEPTSARTTRRFSASMGALERSAAAGIESRTVCGEGESGEAETRGRGTDYRCVLRVLLSEDWELNSSGIGCHAAPG